MRAVVMSVCREPDSGRAEETEEQAAEEGDSGGETKGEAETRGAAATAAAATTEQDKESGSGPGGTEGRGTQSRQTRQGMCPPPAHFRIIASAEIHFLIYSLCSFIPR